MRASPLGLYSSQARLLLSREPRGPKARWMLCPLACWLPWGARAQPGLKLSKAPIPISMISQGIQLLLRKSKYQNLKEWVSGNYPLPHPQPSNWLQVILFPTGPRILIQMPLHVPVLILQRPAPDLEQPGRINLCQRKHTHVESSMPTILQIYPLHQKKAKIERATHLIVILGPTSATSTLPYPLLTKT